MRRHPEVVVRTQGSVTVVMEKIGLYVRKHLAAGAVYIAFSYESFNDLRTNAQNRLMWPLLTDWSRQVEHIDGKKYSPEDWKDITTAAFEGALTYAPNLYGTGLVAMGARTSRYKKKKMRDFIEFLYAEGCERGVQWSQSSNESLEEVRS